jgi:hypothetical protein
MNRLLRWLREWTRPRIVPPAHVQAQRAEELEQAKRVIAELDARLRILELPKDRD